MKNLLLSLLFLILSNSLCHAQNAITKVVNPKEVSSEVRGYTDIPQEIKGLQWHRWTSKNFIVCSINETQAQYLHKHLELVKGWVFSRWGLVDIDFSKPCKLVCVDDPKLFKKLFGIEKTKVEIRREDDGSIKETIIFMLLDESPSVCVPKALTKVCMKEFGQRYDTMLSLWCYKGMSELNCSIPYIKQQVLVLRDDINKDKPIFFSKSLMEISSERHTNLSIEDKDNFERCSMALCLMIRKEFGQDSYLKLMKQTAEGSPEKAIKSVLNFSSYEQLDAAFKRFIIDLSNDLNEGKTPDRYLQIRETSPNS